MALLERAFLLAIIAGWRSLALTAVFSYIPSRVHHLMQICPVRDMFVLQLRHFNFQAGFSTPEFSYSIGTLGDLGKCQHTNIPLITATSHYCMLNLVLLTLIVPWNLFKFTRDTEFSFVNCQPYCTCKNVEIFILNTCDRKEMLASLLWVFVVSTAEFLHTAMLIELEVIENHLLSSADNHSCPLISSSTVTCFHLWVSRQMPITATWALSRVQSAWCSSASLLADYRYDLTFVLILPWKCTWSDLMIIRFKTCAFKIRVLACVFIYPATSPSSELGMFWTIKEYHLLSYSSPLFSATGAFNQKIRWSVAERFLNYLPPGVVQLVSIPSSAPTIPHEYIHAFFFS
jgi:hypothetical protein